MRVTFTADDFGLSEAVNEAVERAHVDGVLDAASLMVAGPAAADAVARARRRPALRVGLHAVTVDGPSVTRPAGITDADGWFARGQVALSVRWPLARAALAAELAAQFAAFAATGLRLGHVDTHKHMSMHPMVLGAILPLCRAYGVRRLRIPAEPPAVLAACGTAVGPGARAMAAWAGRLRLRAAVAGVFGADHCFGIAWSGHMTAARLIRLAAHLPPGSSEVYSHPATHRDAAFARAMPGYDPAGELAALTDPAVRAAFGR